jgi:hypothetical protein
LNASSVQVDHGYPESGYAVIHSTFVTDERLESVLPALTAAVHRGAKVDVLWGQGNDKSEVSTSKKAVDRLRKKFQRRPWTTCFG